MPPPSSRVLQSALALAVAGALCWAALSFDAERHDAAVWPTVRGHAFPKTVRHADGVVADLPRAPHRIVLASTTLVDFVTALVPRDRIAAVCAHAFSASAIALDPAPWAGIATYDRFATEVVLGFRPDLVLCNGYNEPQTAAALHRAGVPVVVLPGPNSLADCHRTFAILGQVLGVEAAATAKNADLDRRTAKLVERALGAPRRRGLCFTYNPTGSWTGGAGTMHDEALRLAGLDNVAALAGIRGHAQVSIEQILAMDPDVLVVDAPVGQGHGTRQFLRESGTLGALRALAAGHVVELPQALYATGSQLVLDTAEVIADAVDGFFPLPESKR